MSKLNPKQEMFCLEYVVDSNGTQAAIRAGYSERTARTQAAQLLAKRNIQARVLELKRDLKAEIKERVVHDAAWLLDRLAEEAQADYNDLFDPDYPNVFRVVKDWPKIWRQGLVTDIEMGTVTLVDKFPGEDGEILEITRRETRPVKVKLSDRLKRLELMGKHKALKAFDNTQEHAISADLAAFFGAIKPTTGLPDQ